MVRSTATRRVFCRVAEEKKASQSKVKVKTYDTPVVPVELALQKSVVSGAVHEQALEMHVAAVSEYV